MFYLGLLVGLDMYRIIVRLRLWNFIVGVLSYFVVVFSFLFCHTIFTGRRRQFRLGLVTMHCFLVTSVGDVIELRDLELHVTAYVTGAKEAAIAERVGAEPPEGRDLSLPLTLARSANAPRQVPVVSAAAVHHYSVENIRTQYSTTVTFDT